MLYEVITVGTEWQYMIVFGKRCLVYTLQVIIK